MKKFLAVIAVFAMCSFAIPCNMQAQSNDPKTQVVQDDDPCADPFSSAVRDDFEGTKSILLGQFLDSDVQILQRRGYCRPLTEESLAQTPTQIADELVKELTAEAIKNGYTISFVGKMTPSFGGNSIVIIVKPDADRIAAAETDYRILTVFVYNKTRIVGIQIATSVTGLRPS